jgi:hypothetical protein
LAAFQAFLAHVGGSAIGNRSMFDWRYDFIRDNIEFTDPAHVAADVKARLQLELGSSSSDHRSLWKLRAERALHRA